MKEILHNKWNDILKDQFEQDYYKVKLKEFMSLKNPSRALLTSLINKIEITEENNIDIYYKFKLI